MSEEESISEEEKDVKRIEIVQLLSALGEDKIANSLFTEIEKKIHFVKIDNWVNEQVCSTFPRVCIKTLVFCCSPSNPCPFRAAVLRKLGLTLKDYVELKKQLSMELESFIKGEKWEKRKQREKRGGKPLLKSQSAQMF